MVKANFEASRAYTLKDLEIYNTSEQRAFFVSFSADKRIVILEEKRIKIKQQLSEKEGESLDQLFELGYLFHRTPKLLEEYMSSGKLEQIIRNTQTEFGWTDEFIYTTFFTLVKQINTKKGGLVDEIGNNPCNCTYSLACDLGDQNECNSGECDETESGCGFVLSSPCTGKCEIF